MGLLANLLFLVVLFLVVYFIFNYFFNRNKFHLSPLQSGTKATTVQASKLPSNNNSNNYAYSIWFYVNNWQYKLTEPKELLTRGGSSSGSGSNPRITLAPYENNINIEIATYPVSAVPKSGGISAAGENSTSCTIRNFPLQKWVNLIISLNGRALDVYIDGKLVRTCILPGVAKIDANANVYVTPDGGFSGWTSNLQYFANPLNPQEAYNIYKKGYGSGGLSGIFDKYKIKIAYLVDNKEEGSIEI